MNLVHYVLIFLILVMSALVAYAIKFLRDAKKQDKEIAQRKIQSELEMKKWKANLEEKYKKEREEIRSKNHLLQHTITNH